MNTCPDCGKNNDEGARFCDNCGGRLDVAPPTSVPEPPEGADARPSTAPASPAGPPAARRESLSAGGSVPLADDGLPVGEDLDGIEGGERLLWQGRPSRLWTPRMSITNRYKLTNQRLMFEFGFIGKTTEEVELYRVTDVGVKQHPLERITRMGDIYIASGDSSAPIKYLHNVAEPERVKDLIREAARQERHRRRVMVREDF